MIVFLKDKLDGLSCVSIFHALAKNRIECVVLTEPQNTCISLGYFDNALKFLDFDYIDKHGIPVIRRQTGGGTVLLHQGQIFYQFIFSKSNKTVPLKMESVYKYFSNIIIEVYKRLGLEAQYRPIADILIKDKKISGQGAGDIENMLVFVGNILLDFDFYAMANIISYIEDKTSFEKMLRGNITTLKEQGVYLDKDKIFEAFLEVLKVRFGAFEIKAIPQDIIYQAKEIEKELTSEDIIKEDTGKKHEYFKIKEGYLIDPSTLEKISL